MTMNPEVSFVINQYVGWATAARREHADLLEKANDLFVEHGFEPFSGRFVDAMANFKTHLEVLALHRMGENPEDENAAVEREIADWSRRNISEGTYDDMILAVIYGSSAADVEAALDELTPDPDEEDTPSIF